MTKNQLTQRSGSMSVRGQSRKWRTVPGTSGLPPRADIAPYSRQVRFVPLAEIVHSFDHLICAGQNRVGNSEAERRGRFEVRAKSKVTGCSKCALTLVIVRHAPKATEVLRCCKLT
jgi:hypothetical protein